MRLVTASLVGRVTATTIDNDNEEDCFIAANTTESSTKENSTSSYGAVPSCAVLCRAVRVKVPGGSGGWSDFSVEIKKDAEEEEEEGGQKQCRVCFTVQHSVLVLCSTAHGIVKR